MFLLFKQTPWGISFIFLCLLIYKILLDADSSSNVLVEPDPVFSPLSVFPIQWVQQPPNAQFPQGFVQVAHQNIDFQFLKLLKTSVTNYDPNSPYVYGLLGTYGNDKLLIPQNGETLAKTVLDPGQYLQFKS